MKNSDILQRMSFALFLFAAVLVAGQSPASESRRVYFFGNSLIHHLSETDETTVPHWLNRIARADGHGFFTDGQWGFLRQFAGDYPPVPNWSFREIRGVWNPDVRPFGRAGFDAIVFNPANFIQGEDPDQAYALDEEQGGSPLSATLDLMEKIRADGVTAPVYLYEGWADMAPFLWGFPPSKRQMRKYHAFNRGAYHDWYVDYADRLAKAGHEVTLIPVASVLAGLMTQTIVAHVPATELYLDEAPHGTPTLYFLASLVTYLYVFGDSPPTDIDLPDSIHPLVRNNLTEIVTYITAEQPQPVKSEAKVQEIVDSPRVTLALSEPKPAQGLAAPALAMGLNGLADWSSQHPFLDVMKTARPWIGHLPDLWGGMDAVGVEASGVLDAAGWPMRLPDGVDRLEAFILTDQAPEARKIAGRYRLTYEGEGEISLTGRARNLDRKPGEIWFDYTPGEGLVGITIQQTDPRRNGNYIKNISVVREEHIALHEVGALFNPDWIDLIKDLRVLRFMDWQFTNGSAQVSWAERPLVSDYTYVRRGAPLEVMLRLAHQVNADPWFNMPHQADDEYVRSFAELVNDELDPARKAYVEYSNEVWNFTFPQSGYAAEMARQTWGSGVGDDGWMRFAGKRAGEVSAIWSAVYGAETDARLVRVIATHTDWPGLEQAMFREIDDVPARFDAYAVTGYFGHSLGNDEMAEVVLEWLAESEALAQSMAEKEGLSGAEMSAFLQEHKYDVALSRVIAYLRQNDLAVLSQEIFPTQAAIAKAQGLDLIMYEGGTHVAPVGGWTGNEVLADFFAFVNYTPDMAGLYGTLLSGYSRAGGKLFNAFVDVSQPSRWGSWGTWRYIGDENPRAARLMGWNATETGPGDYRHGVTETGTAGADMLTGTIKADEMTGGAGDDTFVVAGSDRVHGGAGFDRAILPGAASDYQSRMVGGLLVLVAGEIEIALREVEEIVFSANPEQPVRTTGFGG